MSIRNIIALVLTLISLGLLYPGVTLPILNLTVSAELPILGTVEFYNQTQSILQTVESLFTQKNEFVAILIFVFSIVVPFTKALIMIVVLILKDFTWKSKLYNFVSFIGKWSMADVFVVALFMAFLSTKSNSGITAELLEGFNYFAVYCLVSIASIQIASIKKEQ
ncbi:MAG: paraquat-inducible protein A [Reichenbachiella sp.]